MNRLQYPVPHRLPARSRRDLLFQAGAGIGGLALASLLADDEAFAATPNSQFPISNFQSKKPHFPAKVDSVIFLFMEGGPSHLDLFDPKPELQRLAGQTLPASYGRPITPMGVTGNALLPTKRTF